MTDHRYSRQTMLPEIGPEGQSRITAARVLIVGLGGLGSAASVYLAGAGAGTIGLCDPDTVSLSNLQRQVLYSEAEIGQPKTACAAARLSALNSSIALRLHPEGITADNAGSLVAGYDLVLDCTDNYATRYLIDDACAQAGIPWVHGALGEFCGMVTVFNGRSGVRYADLYPEREELCSAPRPTLGVLGAVPGVIGAIQASEAIKLIAGFGEPLDGKLLTIDMNNLKTEIIEI